MSDLKSYQTSEGLSDDQMAALLTERLGREISAKGYKIVSSRKGAPPEWLEALSIVPQEPVDSRPVSSSDEDKVSATPQVPRPAALALPFEPQSARLTIVMIYTAAGKGAGLALRNDQVAQLWTESAPALADAWIEWARESPTVANYIRALTLGGPAGQVVFVHANLLISTLIVSGRMQMPMPPTMRNPQETDLIDEPSENGNSEPAPGHATRPR